MTRRLIVSHQFDLQQYWNDPAKSKLDSDGSVLENSIFPLLSILARVFHSIDSITG